MEALKSAVKETERKTTIETQRKTTFKILVDMYEDRVDINYIIELAQKNGILKEELLKVIDLKQHSQE